jgi:hypothetical protein
MLLAGGSNPETSTNSAAGNRLPLLHNDVDSFRSRLRKEAKAAMLRVMY